MPSGKYIVRAGDFCQVGLYSYIATADVVRGSGSTVIIPVHRNLISTLASPVNAVIGQYGTTVSMGGDTYTGITFQVVLREYPTYALVPIANDSFIQWSGNFKAFESVL
jgi:L-ascorbate metabolism protein UlaG (beta-lactamase superfamily)